MSRRNHNYYYDDARTSQTGIMRCSVCNKPITEGQYRYRDAGEHYVNQHRACTESDPTWARMDRERVEHHANLGRLHFAAIAFRDAWGIDELDELIERTTLFATPPTTDSKET